MQPLYLCLTCVVIVAYRGMLWEHTQPVQIPVAGGVKQYSSKTCLSCLYTVELHVCVYVCTSCVDHLIVELLESLWVLRLGTIVRGRFSVSSYLLVGLDLSYSFPYLLQILQLVSVRETLNDKPGQCDQKSQQNLSSLEFPQLSSKNSATVN